MSISFNIENLPPRLREQAPALEEAFNHLFNSKKLASTKEIEVRAYQIRCNGEIVKGDTQAERAAIDRICSIYQTIAPPIERIRIPHKIATTFVPETSQDASDTPQSLSQSSNGDIKALSDNISKLTQKIEELENQLRDLNRTPPLLETQSSAYTQTDDQAQTTTLIEALQKAGNDLQTQYNRHIDDLKTQYSSHFDALQTQHSRHLDHLQTQYSRHLDTHEARCTDLLKRIAQEQAAREKAERESSALKEGLQSLEVAKSQAEDALAAIQKDLDAAKVKEEKLNQKIENLEKTTADLREKEQAASKKAETESSALKEKLQHLEVAKIKAEHDLTVTKKDLDAARLEAENLKGTIKDLKTQVSSLEAEKTKAADAESSQKDLQETLKEEVDRLKKQLEEALKEKEKLDEKSTPVAAPPVNSPRKNGDDDYSLIIDALKLECDKVNKDTNPDAFEANKEFVEWYTSTPRPTVFPLHKTRGKKAYNFYKGKENTIKIHNLASAHICSTKTDLMRRAKRGKQGDQTDRFTFTARLAIILEAFKTLNSTKPSETYRTTQGAVQDMFDRVKAKLLPTPTQP